MNHGQALKIAREPVQERLDWYRANAKWPMIGFRLSGIATIILGAMLPAVVSMDEKIIPDGRGRKIAVVLMSVALASLAALSAYYRWEKTWHGRNAAFRALELLIARFDIALANLKPTDDSAESCKRRDDAGSELIVGASLVVSAETEEFFATLQAPRPHSETLPKTTTGSSSTGGHL